MTPEEARAHIIIRYPLLAKHEHDDARMVSAIASSDLREEWRDIAVRWRLGPDGTPGVGIEQYPPASAEDFEAALTLLVGVRRALDNAEARLLDSAKDRKMTWPQIARTQGLNSAQGAQQRRKRLPEATDLIDPDRRVGGR